MVYLAFAANLALLTKHAYQLTHREAYAWDLFLAAIALTGAAVVFPYVVRGLRR